MPDPIAHAPQTASAAGSESAEAIPSATATRRLTTTPVHSLALERSDTGAARSCQITAPASNSG